MVVSGCNWKEKINVFYSGPLMSDRNYFLLREHLVESDRLILFCNNKIVVQGENFIWRYEQLIENLPANTEFLIVEHKDKHYVAASTDQDISVKLAAELKSLRSLLFKESDKDFAIAGKASQILDWYRAHRFCGACGAATVQHISQRALCCPSCNDQYFPRINPCAIVLVTKGREVLLARSARFRSGFFSCLAGFIEVGESAEETVLREVKEESGLIVHNIRYIKSQSWPFPSQLMLGFHADYKSGEIVPEPGEIDEAAFYDIDDMPAVPSPRISVAGELIEIYADQVRKGLI
jgi:NAD+ diphosphatase